MQLPLTLDLRDDDREVGVLPELVDAIGEPGEVALLLSRAVDRLLQLRFHLCSKAGSY